MRRAVHLCYRKSRSGRRLAPAADSSSNGDATIGLFDGDPQGARAWPSPPRPGRGEAADGRPRRPLRGPARTTRSWCSSAAPTPRRTTTCVPAWSARRSPGPSPTSTSRPAAQALLERRPGPAGGRLPLRLRPLAGRPGGGPAADRAAGLLHGRRPARDDRRRQPARAPSAARSPSTSAATSTGSTGWSARSGSPRPRWPHAIPTEPSCSNPCRKPIPPRPRLPVRPVSSTTAPTPIRRSASSSSRWRAGWRRADRPPLSRSPATIACARPPRTCRTWRSSHSSPGRTTSPARPGSTAALLLAPLSDTAVNAARAPVKAFDAARLGAAGLYADAAPYRGFVRAGVDGLLLPMDPEAWAAAIEAPAGRIPRRGGRWPAAAAERFAGLRAGRGALPLAAGMRSMDLSPGRMRSRWRKLRRDPAAFADDLPWPLARALAVAGLTGAARAADLLDAEGRAIARAWARTGVALRRDGRRRRLCAPRRQRPPAGAAPAADPGRLGGPAARRLRLRRARRLPRRGRDRAPDRRRSGPARRRRLRPALSARRRPRPRPTASRSRRPDAAR